jgi:CBS domain containing-hemolysin-like protein
VEYLNETYDLGIAESEEYDTLAGYIIAEYGGIPHEGEEIKNEQFEITIIRREQSRLDLVKVHKNK